MKRFALTAILVSTLLALSGCLTPADRWLTANLMPSEKAEILVSKGTEGLNRLMDTDDLTQVPRLRETFKTALDTDPKNTRAAEGLKKIDSYISKRGTEARTKAKALSAKASLTDKEKYTLVVLVRELQILAPSDLDLTKLLDQVAPIRKEVVAKSTQRVVDAEKALEAAKTSQAWSKALSALHSAIEALKVVDPESGTATGAAQRMNAAVVARNRAEYESARKSFLARDYAKAAQVLERVEQTLMGLGKDSTSDVNDLQYRVYLDWSKELYAAKKFSEAGSRVADALTVRSTSEARDLRDKIASQARDFDAEYEALDKQVEALVKSGDLRAAWNILGSTAAGLKKDQTKAKLEARKKQVLDEAHNLYDRAVEAYNEEDYREAKALFDTVASVDPAWQLVKAYQEKARAKLQALGGDK